MIASRAALWMFGDPTSGWTLPPDGSAAGYGDEMDRLFMIILWITGILFVLTEGLLLFFMWRYRAREGHKSSPMHGHRALEITWTIGTAGLLVWLALYQREQWDKIKLHMPKQEEKPYRVEFLAKQFSWYFRYAGKDGELNTADDKITEKVLIVPANRKVYLQGRSLDVIHSLYIPYMRVKQDVVPGMTIPIWFQVGTDSTGAPWTTANMRKHLKEEEIKGTASAASDGRTFVDAVLLKDMALLHRTLIVKPPGKTQMQAQIRGVDPATGTLRLWDPFLGGPVSAGDPYEIPAFEYDIACAELCGAQHFKMKGTLIVAGSDAEIDEYLATNGESPATHVYGETFWDWIWK
jgi:cytochrome c oxidase subunit 2